MEFEINDSNALPEHLREHCTERDGKRYFSTDRLEDVSGLKSAHERVKAELKEHRAIMKACFDHKVSAADIPELVGARAGLQDAQINHQITIALMRARATAEGVELLAEPLRKRVSVEKGQFRIAGADGLPMPGSGADGLASFDDVVKEAVAKFPFLFLGDGRGGGGASSRRGGASDRTMTRREFDRLPPNDRHRVVKSGTKIVD